VVWSQRALGSATACGGTLVIAPVGSIIAGDARWGHSDMAGNMGEWAFREQRDVLELRRASGWCRQRRDGWQFRDHVAR
jgi:hypothetical protein